MPLKIRLARHGKKGKAFFHIVVADSRAPRDGKFIEKIGTYNPNTNPATILLDDEKAFQWLQNGAQPTDTTRAILSYKGVLYKKHLAQGVTKGALTQEQADAKYENWVSQKIGKVETKKSRISAGKEEVNRLRLEAESKVREAREKAVAAKSQPAAEAEPEPESESPASEGSAETAE